MRRLKYTVILALFGCGDLWTPFAADNPANCMQNASLCGGTTYCASRSEQCESKLLRSGVALGRSPAALVVADFNKDTHLDVAVTEDVDGTGPGQVAVLLGDGAGGFGAPTRFAAGTRPLSIAAGHLDGDPNLDLAVANTSANAISVLLGQGNGTFAMATTSNAGDLAKQPVGIRIGQHLDDNNQRILYANQAGETLSVISSQFTKVREIPGMGGKFSAPHDPVAGNFGTSPFDLAVATATGIFTILPPMMAGGPVILHGPYALSGTDVPGAMAAADFHGDKYSDLAVTTGGDAIAILAGMGGGMLAAAVRYPAGKAVAVAAADLNRDGFMDLVTANGTEGISVLLNQGQGFAAPLHFAIGGNTTALALADLNHDGRPDILALDNNPVGRLIVLLNVGF